jgi:hypothetical protein
LNVLKSDINIVGAGLAGLLAAHAWPRAQVFEAEAAPTETHKALLRFRSDAVSRLTGIEFKPVTVRKGVWMTDRFVAPNIQLANFYAHKVTGKLVGDRSIWSLEPVTRFIAPESFYDSLIETVGDRIVWSTPYDYGAQPLSSPRFATISTAPLPVVIQHLGLKPGITFDRASITVERWRLFDTDVYQTVYFPDPDLLLYRASITGSLLICEYCSEGIPDHILNDEKEIALKAFGIKYQIPEPISISSQRYGKIIPLEPDVRKRLLHDLTTSYGIYSLGRFATWRNVLLDDVVQDIDVLRKLLRASPYDTRIHFT